MRSNGVFAKRLGVVLHSSIFLLGLVFLSNCLQTQFPILNQTLVRVCTISVSTWYLWRCFYKPFRVLPKADWSTMKFPRRNAASIRQFNTLDSCDNNLENN